MTPVQPRPQLEWTLDPQTGRWTSDTYVIERVMDHYELTRNDYCFGYYESLEMAKDAAVSFLRWPR